LVHLSQARPYQTTTHETTGLIARVETALGELENGLQKLNTAPQGLVGEAANQTDKEDLKATIDKLEVGIEAQRSKANKVIEKMKKRQEDLESELEQLKKALKTALKHGVGERKRRKESGRREDDDGPSASKRVKDRRPGSCS